MFPFLLSVAEYVCGSVSVKLTKISEDQIDSHEDLFVHWNIFQQKCIAIGEKHTIVRVFPNRNMILKPQGLDLEETSHQVKCDEPNESLGLHLNIVNLVE
jgi:hypothetical protein